MVVIVSTQGDRTPLLWIPEFEQAAVHLPTKGAINEKEFLTLTHTTFK